MSKIHEAFENGKAFIAFVTGGDPDLAGGVAANSALRKSLKKWKKQGQI